MSLAREEMERLLGKGSVTALESSDLGGELPLALPSSEAELLEALKLAAARRWRVVPMGLGSKLSWSAPPDRVDLALSTRRLAGVVAYEPGDGTLTARAGSTMASLEGVAREGGNHVTPMVPGPDRSTLGGVIAAGQNGIDRARYGPARHHVLGMRAALADGSVARSGGRLVKNVTGYDLHRLWCGSHGTLCVIVEVTLRLFPGFESEARVTAEARDRAQAIELARRVDALRLPTLCVRAENVIDPGRAWRVHALFAGRADVVEWARDRAAETLPGAQASAVGAEEIRDLELRPGRWPSLHVACVPSRLAEALALVPEEARAIVEPAIATVDAYVEGSHLSPRAIGPAGGAGPGAGMMRRLKTSFDPQGLFASGRIHAGI